MPQAGPLSGITIIDLSRILAGPYCTLLLAELGARVIKVETPGTGDDARQYGPFIGGKSTYFTSVNRGKESIVLDLKAPADRDIFERLLDKGDALVENFRPGTMEKLGYGWETLHKRYPQLIYAAASGFGHTGPNSKDPAYDMVVQGMGGIMSVTGFPGGEPTRIGMSIGDVGSGLYTAVAVNAALLHRFRTGEATKVDIAMFDCQLALLEGVVVRYTSEGVVPGPVGSRHATITPFQAFRTKDGNIIIAAGNDSLFVRLCNALGHPGMALDPDYLTNGSRQKNQKRLETEIEAILADKTTAEWIKIIGDAGVPCGPINNIAQALQHPQVEARNMLVTVPDGEGGTLKVSGNPLKMSAFADPPTREAAPDLDANRAAILKELGLD